MGEISYRSYRDGDENVILELYNSVFAKHQSIEQWRWAYRRNPVGRMDIALAFDGTQLVAQSAGIPLVLSHEGQLLQTSRIQNVLVHPDCRGRGIFTQTLLRLTEHLRLHEVDFVLTFPNDKSVPGFLKTRTYEHAFDISQYEWNASCGIAGAVDLIAVELEESPVFHESDVDFVRRELAPFAIHNVRDLPYLTWRYHRDSGAPYRVARAFLDAEQVGFAVVKPYPQTGSIDLVEFVVASDESIVRSLLRGVLAAYEREQLHVLNLWSMPHYPLHTSLLRIGFERTERVTHAMYKRFSARCSSRSGDATAYYLSMGDSDVY